MVLLDKLLLFSWNWTNVWNRFKNSFLIIAVAAVAKSFPPNVNKIMLTNIQVCEKKLSNRFEVNFAPFCFKLSAEK